MKKFRFLPVITLSFIAGSISSTAAVGGKPATMSEVASRACMSEARGAEADDVISSENMRVSNANPKDKEVIASAIRTYSVRSGGKLDGMFRNLQVSIEGNLGQSGGADIGGLATKNSVRLGRNVMSTAGSARATAEATVIHEFAHVLGRRGTGRGNRRLQDDYASASPRCAISTYCTHKVSSTGAPGAAHNHRREEFAEVVTAYIFDPNRLKSQCPQSYEYMKSQVFGGNDAMMAQSGKACRPQPYSRSYSRADGKQAPISGAGFPPGGAQAFIQVGQQLLQMQQLNDLEDQRQQAIRDAEDEEALRSQQIGKPAPSETTD